MKGPEGTLEKFPTPAEKNSVQAIRDGVRKMHDTRRDLSLTPPLLWSKRCDGEGGGLYVLCPRGTHKGLYGVCVGLAEPTMDYT